MSGGTAAGSQPKKHLLQTLHAHLQSCMKVLSAFHLARWKDEGQELLGCS